MEQFAVRRYFNAINPNSDSAQQVAINNYQIDGLLDRGVALDNISNQLRWKSISTLVIELGKDSNQEQVCNYNCPVCFTRDRHGLTGLNTEFLKSIIKQAVKLGCRSFQFCGVGEPTLSQAFWDIVDFIKLIDDGLDIVLFSNGSFTYCDSISADLVTTSSRLVDIINRHQVKVYIKFWTTSTEKAQEYYGVDTDFEIRDGIPIPRSLAILQDRISSRSLGIQVALCDDNFREVKEKILPYANRRNLACFVEPVMHTSPRIADRYSLNHANRDDLQEYLTAGQDYCCNRLAREAIINIDCLSPCIQFPRKNEFRITEFTDLFALFHSKEFRKIRSQAKDKKCACKSLLEGDLL